MSALLGVELGGDTDSWIGPASGPAGKRAYGGQFVAQSLAAARRVDSRQDGRLLTTATVSFAAELPGPEHGHRPDTAGHPDAPPRKAFESTCLEVRRLIGEFEVGEDVSANLAHAERVVEPGPFGLEVGHVGGVGGNQ
jgi:acyl-CoA thioesterase